MNPTSSNRRGAGWVCFAILALAALPAAAEKAFIYVTNSAGDSVHVIDPATNKVVQVIKGIEAPHGVDFAPDGRASTSARGRQHARRRRSQKRQDRQEGAAERPSNNIAVTKDGGRVIVGIAEEPARSTSSTPPP